MKCTSLMRGLGARGGLATRGGLALAFPRGRVTSSSARPASGAAHTAAELEAHDAAVRAEFKRQAASGYGSFDWYAKMEYEPAKAASHVAWVLAQLPIESDMRVLDVACGTGICARSMAPHVASVTGLDQTPEMLAEAKKAAAEGGLANVRFEQGNALALPFEDASFDLVTCRLAVHHFKEPRLMVAEMARVVKPGGKVALIDIIVPEDVAVAAHYNRLEWLRDPTHTAALPMAQLRQVLEDAGLEALAQAPSRKFPVNLNGWMDMTNTPRAARQEILAAVDAELQSGGPETGMRPHRGEDGTMYFLHEWAVVLAQKRV